MLITLLATVTGVVTPTAARFDCGRTVVVARFSNDRAVLRVGDRDYRLAQVAAATGARYYGRADRKRDLDFAVNGSGASLRIGRKVYSACLLADPPLGALARPTVSYRAMGTEPFWNLTVTGQQVRFEEPGAAPLTLALPPVLTTINGRRYEGRDILIDITRQPCSDGMSDRTYPERVMLTVQGRTLNGCGADAAAWSRITGQAG